MYDADDVKHGPAGAGPQAPPSPRPATRLKAERVQLALRAMPGWRLAPGGAAIRRLFPVRDRQARSHFLAYAGALLREPRRELAFVARAEGLECRLSTPAADGVTEQDLELAKELSLLG
jgi:pterin-4a-carbinolamine dehydratase